MTQHIWHKEIKAWADGAEIQAKSADFWFTDDDPSWNDPASQFRIKPQPKEKKFLYVYRTNKGIEFGVSFIPDNCLSSDMSFIGKIEVLDD